MKEPAASDAASGPEECTFVSDGVVCRGDLYRPTTHDGEHPAIVMGHGFGATRACGLSPFAEAFAAAGYVVFAFDYRSFGTSDGRPRRVLRPRRQVEDFLAAADFVRGRPEVSAERVALWGTSFGGGVATVAASRDHRIRAVVAQCPMMDGWAATMQASRNGGILQTLRLGAHGLRDLAAGLVRREPHRIPAAGRPGTVAAMTADDCADGYGALVPPDVPTDVAARFVFEVPRFRPVSVADQVACPVLVLVCETDSVAPPAAAERAAERMAHATVRQYSCGHFDVYQEPFRTQSIRDQLDFLDAHLTDPPTRSAPRPGDS